MHFHTYIISKLAGICADWVDSYDVSSASAINVKCLFILYKTYCTLLSSANDDLENFLPYHSKQCFLNLVYCERITANNDLRNCDR